MVAEVGTNYFRIQHERGQDGSLHILGREPVAGPETHKAGIRLGSQVDLTRAAAHEIPPLEVRFSAELPGSGSRTTS